MRNPNKHVKELDFHQDEGTHIVIFQILWFTLLLQLFGTILFSLYGIYF